MKSTALVWTILAIALAVPLLLAANSPLLQYRDPIYIVAAYAGVIGMALLLLQPLLASGTLPGISALRGRRVHRWLGATLLIALVIHVAGLWITSPPDMIDALLFRSPTPFSVWGVIGMWAVLITATLAVARSTLKLKPTVWRFVHKTLAVIIVVTSVIHAVLIDGTMEFFSKTALCALVFLATLSVIIKRRK